MTEPVWILDEVAQAIHSILLSEHGGGTGIRDEALLESALSRPQQKYNYEPTTSIFELAAAYSFSIASNHPFVDGNKRTAFTVGTLFLEMNGVLLIAPEPDAAITFENLAAGKISEKELAVWFGENSRRA